MHKVLDGSCQICVQRKCLKTYGSFVNSSISTWSLVFKILLSGGLMSFNKTFRKLR